MKKFKTLGLALITLVTAIWGLVLMFSFEDMNLKSFGLLLFFSAYNTVIAYFRVGLVNPEDLLK